MSDGEAITPHGRLWEFDASDGHGVNPTDCGPDHFPCSSVDKNGTIEVSLP